MTGYPNFNFDAFHAAAKKFKDMGWTVFNPAEKDEEDGVVDGAGWSEGDDQKLVASGWDFRAAFTWDCQKVIEADAIYVLKGWEASSGATAEIAVAKAIKARYPEYEIIYQ
jgi:hypothetical protein